MYPNLVQFYSYPTIPICPIIQYNCTNYLVLLRYFHIVSPNPSLVWIGSNSLQSILDWLKFGLIYTSSLNFRVDCFTNLFWNELIHLLKFEPIYTTLKSMVRLFHQPTTLPLNFKQGSEHLMRGVGRGSSTRRRVG